MTLGEKLKKLRTGAGLTQEELAEKLFVTRTAISKWESDRGCPNIESLKLLSGFFSVTLDELLSSGEVLKIAEEDNRRREGRFCDLVFGLLDASVAMFFFLPFFGQKINDVIEEVSLLSLTEISPWLRISYFVAVIGSILLGALTLTFRDCHQKPWLKYKRKMSVVLSAVSAFLFIVSAQPYAAVFLFGVFAMKTLIIIKR